MLQMNETCDRCGPAVRAAYRVTRDGELYLCRHCASQLWPALSAQGWASTAALRAAGRTRAGPWSAPWSAIGAPWAGLPVLFMTQWRRIEALTSEPGPFICRVSRTAMTPIALD